MVAFPKESRIVTLNGHTFVMVAIQFFTKHLVIKLLLTLICHHYVDTKVRKKQKYYINFEKFANLNLYMCQQIVFCLRRVSRIKMDGR